MWLPTPLYKSLPALYAVIGVIFILGVLYVGVDTQMGPTYLGLGLVSILASISLHFWRNKHRKSSKSSESDDSQ